MQDISPNACSDDESCSHLLRKSLENDPKVSFHISNNGYEIISELQSASVKVQSIDLDTGEIAYTASAEQKITVTKEDSQHYPVWDGEKIAFDRMRLVYINRVTS